MATPSKAKLANIDLQNQNQKLYDEVRTLKRALLISVSMIVILGTWLCTIYVK